MCLLPAGVILFMTGCEYDGPTAVYDQPYSQATPPVIDAIEPAEAAGGVNLITITGQNFSENSDDNRVYISNIYYEGNEKKTRAEKAEIVDFSTTSISIRRPGLFGDSTVVKVVNYQAHVYDSLYPYRITQPYELYGGFTITGNQLDAVAVDQDENLYVVQRSGPRMVYKVSPGGEKTELGDQGTNITDAMLAPDGNLVLLTGRSTVVKMDVTTGVPEDWYMFSSSRTRVKFGDFDSYGNLITAGTKTGLIALKPDMTEGLIDDYSDFDILDVRVYQGAVYVLAENTSPDTLDPVLAPEIGIWRNTTAADPGSFGEKELVLDWATTGSYDSSGVYDMTFSSDGTLIVCTDNTDPVLLYDLESDTHETFYKSILPSSMVHAVWGQGNHLYMIQFLEEGDTRKWDLYKVDMGTTGAPYYGRP